MVEEHRAGAGVDERARLRSGFSAALSGAGSAVAAADRLCAACVEHLDVDGASISLIRDGATQGTFGSSGELSRQLDELQFTFGEGPCLDAVREGTPVLAADLADPSERRWPAFTTEVLSHGIHAVFALPVRLASVHIGALDLFRARRGGLSAQALDGGLLAAELAALPLLDLMTSDVDWDAAAEGGSGWHELASLERVEVYQATGMIMSALDIGATEALVRLRGHAVSRGITASEAAWEIVEDPSSLDAEGWHDHPRGAPGSPW